MIKNVISDWYEQADNWKVVRQDSSTDVLPVVSMETNWRENLNVSFEIHFDIAELCKMSLRQQLSHNLSFALKVQGWAHCLNSAPAIDMHVISVFKPFTTLLTAFQNTSVCASPQYLRRHSRGVLDGGHCFNSYLQGAETLRDAVEGSASC